MYSTVMLQRGVRDPVCTHALALTHTVCLCSAPHADGITVDSIVHAARAGGRFESFHRRATEHFHRQLTFCLT